MAKPWELISRLRGDEGPCREGEPSEDGEKERDRGGGGNPVEVADRAEIEELMERVSSLEGLPERVAALEQLPEMVEELGYRANSAFKLSQISSLLTIKNGQELRRVFGEGEAEEAPSADLNEMVLDLLEEISEAESAAEVERLIDKRFSPQMQAKLIAEARKPLELSPGHEAEEEQSEVEPGEEEEE